MRFLKKLSVLFGVFVCLQAGAVSVPVRSIKPEFKDTTQAVRPNQPSAPMKKTGFFGKLKNKLLALALKPSEGSSNVKKTLGWVSIGMFVLGIASFAFAPLASLFLIPGGIVVGIVALCLKGDPNNKTERRTSRLLAILGIVLGLGLIIGLAIAFSSSRWG